ALADAGLRGAEFEQGGRAIAQELIDRGMFTPASSEILWTYAQNAGDPAGYLTHILHSGTGLSHYARGGPAEFQQRQQLVKAGRGIQDFLREIGRELIIDGSTSTPGADSLDSDARREPSASPEPPSAGEQVGSAGVREPEFGGDLHSVDSFIAGILLGGMAMQARAEEDLHRYGFVTNEEHSGPPAILRWVVGLAQFGGQHQESEV